MRAAGLSRAEREVLRLLAAGHTLREVAEFLAVSVRTAQRHKTQIARKAGLRTRAAMVRYALSLGLTTEQSVC